jgi:hypothetical protein
LGFENQKRAVMKSALQFVAAWIAVWCQVVVVAALPLDPPAARANTIVQAPICQFHAGKGQPAPARPADSGHDCAFCVMCQTPTGTIAAPATNEAPAPSQVVAVVRFAVAQPRAPPPFPAVAAQPRGPPTLI